MHVLGSFHYFGRRDLSWLPEGWTFFADSGAYSAMTQGAVLSVHDYGQWAQENASRIHLTANLDLIGDAETTWRNQRILETEYGLDVLPVFHVDEGFEWLHRYVDDGHRYIALGVAGSRSSKYIPWLVQCFREVAGRGVEFHGFGITAFDAIRLFPWRSLDSSTWVSGQKYGAIKLLDLTSTPTRWWSVHPLMKPDTDGRRFWRHLAPKIRKLGEDPRAFYDALQVGAGTSGWPIHPVNGWNAWQYIRIGEWLSRRYRKDVDVYLVDASSTGLLRLGEHLELKGWTP